MSIDIRDVNEDFYNVDVNRLLASFTMNYHFQCSIAINNYPSKIANYFKNSMEENPFECCKHAQIPYAFGFDNFGLIIQFDKKAELRLHNEDMQLIPELKELVEQFGVVIIKNACLTPSIEKMFHRNNFAHLNFHTDRNDNHENRYSLYTRSPHDDAQMYPRKASTLFIDNAVAFLQAKLEGMVNIGEVGRRSKYEIFRNNDVNHLFGSIIIEQPWNEPFGTGEIAVINNNSVLHSSYKHGFDKGYYIGARYLS